MAINHYNTQKIFLREDKAFGKKLVGADFILVPKFNTRLAFGIKTAQMPSLKNSESIEYSTAHGVKTSNPGYIQTYNELSTSIYVDEFLNSDAMINEIIMNDDENGDLEIDIFAGRTIDSMVYYGKIEFAHLTREEGVESDTEDTTTPISFQLMIKGHFFPVIGKSEVNIKDILKDRLKV